MFGIPFVGSILSGLMSPAGRIILIAVAFVAWTAYQRDQAADSARQECRAEQIQRTLDEVTRQRNAAWAVIADDERQAAATEREMAELEQERDRIRSEAAARASSECRFTPDSLKRLRDIR